MLIRSTNKETFNPESWAKARMSHRCGIQRIGCAPLLTLRSFCLEHRRFGAVHPIIHDHHCRDAAAVHLRVLRMDVLMKTDLNAGRAEFLDTEIISAERPGQISSRAEMPA